MNPIRVLIVGNGGREHAIAWKLSQSSLVESILVVPGNGGTALCQKTVNNTTVEADDYEGLVALAQKNDINLVVPGPEKPLVDGIEGYFRSVGIPCFGPSKLAARMEGSKAFSKDFMKRHNIPTAVYKCFSNCEDAKKYVRDVEHHVVIKASGLAGGKGVVNPSSSEEAFSTLENLMKKRVFGSAGDEVVIEECLLGEELSILTFTDGYTSRSLPPARDYKSIYADGKGPNTGGMGCYAPVRIDRKGLMEEIEKKIIEPTISGMRNDRFPFHGLLYTGIMVTKEGPKVLEYNVRFGDPEAQTLLPLLSKDTDLAELMMACTEGWLSNVKFEVDRAFSATVMVVPLGYPQAYPKGMALDIRPAPTFNLFHGGTTLKEGKLLTSGGRVIASQAVSDTLEEAVALAYSGVEGIKFDGMYSRHDIGKCDLKVSPRNLPLTYTDAGVDIEAGNDFVNRIKKAVASTARAGADAEIGGFAGELDLEKVGYKGAPILVGAIDGVGTKLMIAKAMKIHDTVGIDLVAMSVNDLVVQGAEPLIFLDYYGCSILNEKNAASFVEGVAQGCRISKCALIGGETAIMPDMYKIDDYDAAGAAVGVVPRHLRLPMKDQMVAGDILVGLASAGVHSNGFSLVRRILEREGLSYDQDYAPWDKSELVGSSLLTPTRIYVDSVLRVTNKKLVKGLSHITGGGLLENVPRILPSNLNALIDVSNWPWPPVFQWLKKAGNVPTMEMARTFNNGIGMVAVVGQENLDEVILEFKAAGETVYQIGHLEARQENHGKDRIILQNIEKWTISDE
ncbi:Bifunctional purine biosynthetic protein ADE1 [Golovinomyces cichoracearum]|uniref:Bifunctional purine biosynthetic protein ADE1 n=1 Tax=Golovinomyces cichoracearum TaxID=62708 RepID=A0A420HIX4_9PEZI|nr:Bifunctional purine biosynthetic protein ADE1 [Golovinomyces cichoracearum]